MKLTKFSIVVVAENQACGILSPAWVQEKLAIAEPGVDYLTSPVFSQFESDSYHLSLTENRLEITAKNPAPSAMTECGRIAKTYIGQFPGLDFESVGLNYVWSCGASDGDSAGVITVHVNGDDLGSMAGISNPSYGGTVMGPHEDCVLRLALTNEPEGQLIAYFNYSFSLDRWADEHRDQPIDRISALYEKSERVCGLLAGRH